MDRVLVRDGPPSQLVVVADKSYDNTVYPAPVVRLSVASNNALRLQAQFQSRHREIGAELYYPTS